MGNQDVVLKFLECFLFSTKPCIVLDATFGSINLLKQINQLADTAVMSVANNICTDLWQVLSQNTTTGTWRFAIHNEGFIASSHTIIGDKNKRTYQHLFTNACTGTIINSSSLTNNVSIVSQSTMPIFTYEELKPAKLPKLLQILQERNKAGHIQNIDQSLCTENFI